MRYPTRKKLIPLAKQFVRDHPRFALLKSGQITNGRRGLHNCTFKDMYELAVIMYKFGFIRKTRSGYEWVQNFKGMAYPYVRNFTQQQG